jgi:GntR family transcriptional regulator/MocR family aminotransferase
LDKAGLIVDKLYDHPQIKAVYVSPSHHDPIGTEMSLSRRLELLKWAKATGGILIEDDRDNEFLPSDKSLPSLQGLDSTDRVVYLSTFERTMFPLLRLGYAVLPRSLTDIVHRSKALVESGFVLLEQRTLTDFINDGHFEKHIKRLRTLHHQRRIALTQALTKYLPDTFTISDAAKCVSLLVQNKSMLSENVIISCAQQTGLPMSTTNSYYVDQAPTGEFLIPFAHLDEQQIHSIVEQFASKLAVL